MEPIVGGGDGEAQNWRSRERMKTVSVALVVCLNVGVDPPGNSISEISVGGATFFDRHTPEVDTN